MKNNDLVYVSKEDIEMIKKQKEILSILKRTNLDLDYIRLSKNYGVYKAQLKHGLMLDPEITKEEFNLLKEWLNEHIL